MSLKDSQLKTKLFAFTGICIFSVIILFLTLCIHGLLPMIYIAIFLLIVINYSKPLWLPENHIKTSVGTISLALAASTVASYGFLPIIFQKTGRELLLRMFPSIDKSYITADVSPIVPFSFILLVIFIVNFFCRDTSAMKKHSKPIKNILDYDRNTTNKTLKLIIADLESDINKIDRQSNWSPNLFEPLQADVEVFVRGKSKRKLADLLKALRHSKEKIILIIGDPGSGKSVALRKLALDLLKEVKKTGKIPLYINLKEWIVEKKWTVKNKPSVQDLYNYVKESVLHRNIGSDRFFKKHYDDLFNNGRLYFLLDSFDEIPAVLDENENSQLIHHLSSIFYSFLIKASSQGILASRPFRKPTEEFNVKTRLEIRPFTENKIISVINNSGIISKEIIYQLFHDREELIPVARNPFLAQLLSEYLINNDNKLPQNQNEMYKDYIDRTLEECCSLQSNRGLSKLYIKNVAIEIADLMFEKYGLEVPIRKLKKDLSHLKIDDVVNVLKFSHLGRIGGNYDNRFSFAHRRLAEYFAIQKVIKKHKIIKLEAIPSDSQWRDALVLYCEVADEKEASEIAVFCWNTINKYKNPQDLRVIHALRFLRDAFRGRPHCIISFRNKLARYINSCLTKNNHIMNINLAIEIVSLLNIKNIDFLITKAFRINNKYVSESAVRSCRNLQKISFKLKYTLFEYIYRMGPILYNKNSKDFLFSFKLSEAFREVYNLCLLRYIDNCIFCLLLIISIYYFPSYFILVSILILIFLFIGFFNPSEDILRDYTTGTIFFSWSFVRIFLSFCFISFILHPSRQAELSIFNYTHLSPYNIVAILIAILSIPFYLVYCFLIIMYQSLKINKLVKSFLDMIIDNLFTIIIGIPLMITFFVISPYLDRFVKEIIKYLKQFDLVYILLFLIGLFIIAYIIVHTSYVILRILIECRSINRLSARSFKSRKQVYDYINKLSSEYTKDCFLNFIESNVKSIKGQWPSSDLVDATDNNNIRLSIIDARWLSINR